MNKVLIAVLMVFAVACTAGADAQTAPAPQPRTLTEEARAYAECVLGNSYGPYTGHNSRGHVFPQLQAARCHRLLPEDSQVTSPEEFRNCHSEHTRWAAQEYGITSTLNGFPTTQLRVYAEMVCSPMPPPAQ